MTCRIIRIADPGSAAHPMDPRGRVPLDPFGLGAPPMSEVTRILSAIEQIDPSAGEQLLPPCARRRPSASNPSVGAEVMNGVL
jgi:hypothetical protein